MRIVMNLMMLSATRNLRSTSLVRLRLSSAEYWMKT